MNELTVIESGGEFADPALLDKILEDQRKGVAVQEFARATKNRELMAEATEKLVVQERLAGKVLIALDEAGLRSKGGRPPKNSSRKDEEFKQTLATLGIASYPKIIRLGLSEEEKCFHARALNIKRCKLSQELVRTVIADQLKETPEKSDRAIADKLGVSHPTVAKTRKQLEDSGELVKFTNSICVDGRSYPRRRYRFQDDTLEGERAILASAKEVSQKPAAAPAQ